VFDGPVNPAHYVPPEYRRPVVRLDPTAWDAAGPEARQRAEGLLEEWRAETIRNPLAFYEAAGAKHHDFHLAARPRAIRMLAGGNRAAKTTTGVVDAALQMVPSELVAAHLAPYKHHDCARSGPFRLRVVVPDLIQTGAPIHECLRRWLPRQLLRAGSYDRSWRGSEHRLHLECGCFMELLSTEMDLDKHGGTSRHRVLFDEEPPQAYFTENAMRVGDVGGDLVFTFTPLQGLTWMFRELWKLRGQGVVSGWKVGMRDNRFLSPADIDFVLSLITNEQERRQREFGEFAERGGPVYPTFADAAIDHPSRSFLEHREVSVVLDPGLNVAGLVWIAWDRFDRATVFAAANLVRHDVDGYVKVIHQINDEWGIDEYELIVDPASSAGNLVDGRSVIDALVERGEQPEPANNALEAGVDEVRSRLNSGTLKVSRALTGLFDEAVEYANAERDDGAFLPKKNGREHRLDCVRYGVMSRPWAAEVEREHVQGAGIATGPPRRGSIESIMGAMA
jgi:phage terminase large subunit-like protein